MSNFVIADMIWTVSSYFRYGFALLGLGSTGSKYPPSIAAKHGPIMHVRNEPIGNYQVSIIYLFTQELYETALMQNGAIVYIDDIDYVDVRRFDTLDKVNIELKRLRQCEILFE